MREYVDGVQGPGAWDRMHDLIEQKQIAGWSLPPITVDGRNVNIFPGEDREVTLDAVRNEIRKVFAQLDAGDFEEVQYGDLDTRLCCGVRSPSKAEQKR